MRAVMHHSTFCPVQLKKHDEQTQISKMLLELSMMQSPKFLKVKLVCQFLMLYKMAYSDFPQNV